jgi:prepilin-type N-terminal cleavage/methylation domain-containing protein
MKDLAKRLRARAQTAEIEGEEAAEAGFTLIELMVVLLIIAILLAIAIPTFLGVTNTASDRSSQSNLSNALTEGKTLYEVNGAFANSGATAYTSASFTSQAPEFQWNVGTLTVPAPCPTSVNNCVSALVFNVNGTDSEGLSLAVDSTKTNTCWYILDFEATPGAGSAVTATVPGAGVFYGTSPTTGANKGIPATGCAALNPDSDTNINIGTGQGQSYSNASSMF